MKFAIDIMFWKKEPVKKEQKSSQTIDLRKKQPLFSGFSKKKEKKDTKEIIKCKSCLKEIVGKPVFCNLYLTRTRLCNAGPFCSDKCWKEHLDHRSHY